MCKLCASPKHSSKDCYGNIYIYIFQCRLYHSKSHSTALCPSYDSNNLSTNVCMAPVINKPNLLLPIVMLTVSLNNIEYSFKCLLNAGSQRSYFCGFIWAKLKCKTQTFPSSVYEVRAFFIAQRKTLKQAMLDVLDAGNSRKFHIDVEINIQIKVNSLHNLIKM